MMNSYVLIPVIVGLFCAYFGYLLGRLKANRKYIEEWSDKYSVLKQELQVCRTDLSVAERTNGEEWQLKYQNLEKELEACKQQLFFVPQEERKPMSPRLKSERPSKLEPPASFQIKADGYVSEKEQSSNVLLFDAAAAKEAFNKKIKWNDLKIIEGIGPKIENLLQESKIDSWEGLSETVASDLKKILDAAGSKFKMHDPTSWPIQAKMAVNNEWKNLKTWQDTHNAGKLS